MLKVEADMDDDIVYEAQADILRFRKQAQEKLKRVIDELFELEFRDAA